MTKVHHMADLGQLLEGESNTFNEPIGAWDTGGVIQMQGHSKISPTSTNPLAAGTRTL